MKKDYVELEGKEVIVQVGIYKIVGLVAGCHYDIGITVVRKANKEREITCLNRKEMLTTENTMWDRKAYRQCFHAFIKQIKDGVVNPEYLMYEAFRGNKYNYTGAGSHGASCAWK